MTSLWTAMPWHFPADIPSPPRGVWELDLGFVTFPLRAYALFIIIGIVVAIWWTERRWLARGGRAGMIIDVAVWAVPFGLIGGRIYHVITDNQKYFGEAGNFWHAFRIWDGGLGIWGAIAFGAVGALIACRRKGVPLPAVADAAAPGIVVAQAIGRIGNYFNQELFGGPTDLPWALIIYHRTPDNLTGISTGVVDKIVHPTFLYELLWNLAVAAVVVWADRRFRLGHGRAFALYVAGYTLGRTWIELMRVDEANTIFGVRVNVYTSILVFLAAVAYFVLARKRGERETPEQLQGNPEKPTDDTEADDTDAADADADAVAEVDNGEDNADDVKAAVKDE